MGLVGIVDSIITFCISPVSSLRQIQRALKNPWYKWRKYCKTPQFARPNKPTVLDNFFLLLYSIRFGLVWKTLFRDLCEKNKRIFSHFRNFLGRFRTADGTGTNKQGHNTTHYLHLKIMVLQDLYPNIMYTLLRIFRTSFALRYFFTVVFSKKKIALFW